MNPLKKTWSLPSSNLSPVELIKLSKPAVKEENTADLLPPHFRPISHFQKPQECDFFFLPDIFDKTNDSNLFVSGVDFICKIDIGNWPLKFSVE